MKKILIAVIASAIILLLVPLPVAAASGVVVDKTEGDGSWTSNVWSVNIYPGEQKSTIITLYNPSSYSSDIKASVEPDSHDNGNLTFQLDKSSFSMPERTYTELTLTVEASGSTIPGAYTAQLEIGSTEVIPTPAPTDGGTSIYTTTNTDFCGVSSSFLITRGGRVVRTTTAGCEDSDLIVIIEKNTIALDKDGKGLRSLSTHEDTDPPPLPKGDNFIGLPFTLGPSGATFDPPLLFTWTYNPEDIPEGVAPEDINIVYWDGTKWITLTGVVNTETHTVTAEVSHFTTFALVAPAPVVKPALVLPEPEEPAIEEPVPVVEEPVVEELEPVVEEEPTVEEPVVEGPEKPEIIESEKPSYLWVYILGGILGTAGLFWLWQRRKQRT